MLRSIILALLLSSCGSFAKPQVERPKINQSSMFETLENGEHPQNYRKMLLIIEAYRAEHNFYNKV
jgi:hypothetical protein